MLSRCDLFLSFLGPFFPGYHGRVSCFSFFVFLFGGLLSWFCWISANGFYLLEDYFGQVGWQLSLDAMDLAE